MIATPGAVPPVWHHGVVPRLLPLALIPLLWLSASCSASGDAVTSPSDTPTALVTFAGSDAALAVEVADTDAERQRGLSGRSSLPADTGMVFVRDDPVDATFWMKDTLIPLSVAFIGDGGRILAIAEMTPCEANPCPTYGAPGPFSLAVEAPAGWFAANDIAVGDVATVDLP
jgi:hypothetical protein